MVNHHHKVKYKLKKNMETIIHLALPLTFFLIFFIITLTHYYYIYFETSLLIIIITIYIVHQWVRDEIQQLRKSYEQSRTLSKEMERRYQSLLEQSNNLLNQIRSKEQQLDQAEEGLYGYTEKLAQAEKRHDRLESKAVASLLSSSGLIGEQQEDDISSSIITSNTSDNIQSTPDTTQIPTTTTTSTTQPGEFARPEVKIKNKIKKE